MARTGRVNHTHKYYRHSNGLWHCSGIEGCSHYVPKNMPEPVGRKCICWSCEKEFQLLPYHMNMDKPVCDACSEQLEKTSSFIEHFMGGPQDEDPVVRAMRRAKEQREKREAQNQLALKKPVTDKEEEDRIEIIEADEGHAPDCDIWMKGECTCR
jgi:hypothetical protein